MPDSPWQQLQSAMKADRRARGGGGVRAKWKRDSRGRNHPSAGEADWFDLMYQREKQGLIQILEIEPAFKINITTPAGRSVYLCTVKADLLIFDAVAGAKRWIDYKGRSGDTEVSRLKHKMVRLHLGVTIELVGAWVEAKARAKAKKASERALLKRASQ